MNDDTLDTMIRGVVAAAVAAAPEPLEYAPGGHAPLIALRPPERRHWGLTLGLASAAAAVLLGVLVLRPAEQAAEPGAPVTDVTTASTASTASPPQTAVGPDLAWTAVPSWVTAASSPTWPAVGNGFVAAGPDGVWEFGGGGRAVQWSDQPAELALKAPDGSMIVQRKAAGPSGSGTPRPSNPADTVPMVLTAPMAVPVALPATLDSGYYAMHDVARLVDGSDVLLLEWFSPVAGDAQAGSSGGSRLVSVDLGTGTVQTVAEAASLPESVQRLHLTSTGIAVGEAGTSSQTGMLVVPLTGLSFTPQAFTFEDVGLAYAYDDGSGPTGYTIDTAGTTAAWVDQGGLWVRPIGDRAPSAAAATAIPLPWWNELFLVTDVEINGTIAIVSGHQGKSEARSTYVVTLATGESLPIGEGPVGVTMVP